MVSLHLKTKQLWVACFTFVALSFQWGCIETTQVARAGDIEINSLETQTFQTRTGKTIIVSETHPAGRSLSTIQVNTTDFEHNHSEMFADQDPVSKILLADLDNNGFDEIYIITTSAGSGSYGKVLGFASNRDKSLSMIHFPEIQAGDERFMGYQGHDSFAIEGRKLVRKFPVYCRGDTNRNPTCGSRKLVYGLYPGEAMWQLKIKRHTME